MVVRACGVRCDGSGCVGGSLSVRLPLGAADIQGIARGLSPVESGMSAVAFAFAARSMSAHIAIVPLFTRCARTNINQHGRGGGRGGEEASRGCVVRARTERAGCFAKSFGLRNEPFDAYAPIAFNKT